jgi:hypothetical protein
MKLSKYIQQFILLVGATAALAASADYMGTLKVPNATAATPTGFYSFSASSLTGLAPMGPSEPAYRLKLGYKYSRYLAVESEFVDFGSNAGSLFANPANLASGFRNTGFGVDTIATRVRYGLGMRYDFTKSLGIRAELERYSPLGSPVAGELETDLFSVGLMWRF